MHRRFIRLVPLLLAAALAAACTSAQQQLVRDTGKSTAVLALNAAKLAAALDRLDRKLADTDAAVGRFLQTASLTDPEVAAIRTAQARTKGYRDYLRRTIGDRPGTKEIVLNVAGLCAEYERLPPAYTAARAVVRGHTGEVGETDGYFLRDWDAAARSAHRTMAALCESGSTAGVDVTAVLGIVETGIGLYRARR